MKTCHQCGETVHADDAFCGKCGVQQENSKLLCSNCGNAFNPKDEFCPACGTAVQPKAAKKPSVTKKLVQPTSTHMKPTKKRGCFGCFFKAILLGIVLLVLGIGVIYFATDWLDKFKTSYTIRAGEAIEEIQEALQSREENSKKLSMDDIHSADKYMYGIEVEADQYEALRRYEIYAEQGDVNAMVQLSNFYNEGIWVEKDVEKAKNLLRQAAEKGSVEAQWQLEYLESINQ